jgi:hypothetical protein
MIVDLHGFDKELDGELFTVHTKKRRTSKIFSTLHMPHLKA